MPYPDSNAPQTPNEATAPLLRLVSSTSSRDRTAGNAETLVNRSRDDVELLKRARAGEKEVPALVYDRFASDINRLVWRLLGADSEHDDLVHQIFIKIVLGIGRVRDPHALRGWVSAVAINTVCSNIRRRNKRRVFQIPDHDAISNAASPSPDYEGRRMLDATYALFDRMPANERVVFVLRYVDRRPLAEVATLCECSLATVKRRLTKAYRRFSKLAYRDPLLCERFLRSPMSQAAAWRKPTSEDS